MPSKFDTTVNATADELEEKVYYCRSCHSLMIIADDTLADDYWDGTYCGKCGCTDIGVTTIGEWLAEEQRWKDKRREIEWNK